MCKGLWVVGLMCLILTGCGDNPEHLVQQAELAMNSGKPDMAVDYAQRALDKEPQNPEALRIKAEGQLQLGRLRQSRNTLDTLLELDPESSKANVLLAEWAVHSAQSAYLGEDKKQSIDERIADYTAALELAKKQADWLESKPEYQTDAWFVLARMEENQARRLHSILNAALEARDQPADSNPMELADVHTQDDDEDGGPAIPLLSDNTDLAAVDTDQMRKEIDAHFDKAIAYLSRIIEKKSEQYDAANMYVRLLVQRQRWDELTEAAKKIGTYEKLPPALAHDVILALMSIPAGESLPIEERVAIGRQVRELVSRNSRDTSYYRIAGARLLIAENKWEEAKQPLLSVTKEDAGNIQAGFLLAACYYNTGQFDEAEKLLMPISALLPDSPQVQSLYGQTLIRTENFAAAKNALDQAMRLMPDDMPTRIAWMRVCAQLGLTEDAAVHITQFYNDYPDDSLAITLKMALERNRGHKDKVTAHLTQLERQENLNEMHLLALMDGYRFLGRFDKVEEFARQLQTSESGSLHSELALVEAMLAQQNTEQAQKQLDQLREKYPDHLAVNGLYAQTLINQNQYDRAVKILEPAVKANAHNHHLRLMLAQAYMGLSRSNDAIRQIEYVLDQVPSDIHARAMAVRVYQMTRQQDKVAEQLHMIDTSKLNAETWPALVAQVELNNGRIAEAQKICETSLEGGHNDPVLRMMLSSIYEQQGKTEQAQQQLLKLLESQPGNTQVYQHFSRFCLRNERVDEGLSAFERYHDRDPELSRLGQAWLLLAAQRPDEAIAKLTPLLAEQIAAENELAMQIAVTVSAGYAQKQNTQQAVAVFDPFVQNNFMREQAQLAQIDLLINAGAREDALRRTDALVAQLAAPSTDMAMTVLQAYARLGNFDRTLRTLDQFIAASPDDVQLLIAKGNLLLDSGRAKDAFDAYDRASRLNPQDLIARKGMAKAHIAMGNFPQAETVYTDLRNLGNDGVIASYQGLGELYLMLGLNDKALESFERMERHTPPRNPAILLDVARSYMQLGAYREASFRLEQIRRFASQYGAAQTMLAEIELREGRSQAAMSRLQQLLQYPGAAGFVMPVMLEMSIEDPANAQILQWYDESLDMQSLSRQQQIEWLTRRVQMYSLRGEWEPALAAAESMQPLLPDNDSIAMMRFILNAHLDRQQQARDIYLSAQGLARSPIGPLAAALVNVDADPQAKASPVGQYILARMAGDLERARSIARAMPPYMDIFRQDILDGMDQQRAGDETIQQIFSKVALANIAMELNLKSLVSEICNDVINKKPDVVIAWGILHQVTGEMPSSTRIPLSLKYYHAAMQHRTDGNDELAVQNFEELLQREPANIFVMYTLAQACESAAQYGRAINLYRRLYQNNTPLRSRAGNDLAYLMVKQDESQIEEAYAMAENILKTDPNSPSRVYLLDTLGWIEHKRGNNRKALEYLAEAIVQLKDSPDVHEHLGAVYQALGNSIWARYHLTRARYMQQEMP